MEISIKTQSIEVSAVSGGGSINIGNTLNMMMRKEVPPPPPEPGEPLPPDQEAPPAPPPQEGMEPPPGTPPREGIGPQPPPGSPPQAPGAPIGWRTPERSEPFYPLPMPDRTIVGLPFYRLT